jgi:Na+-transporting NADH:ubiquinone oxidoreductase subunit NqrB
MTTAALVSLSPARPLPTRPGVRGPFDPRSYQIATLAALLAYGLTALAFDVRPLQVAVIVATALATQYACGRRVGLARLDVRSPLISALSLCLLLRTNSLALAATGAVIAIGSKFVLRVRGKHVFNPTNVALVALIAAAGGVWVSPGQWGSAAFFAFLMACLGGLVVHRAARSDVTYAFLAFHVAVVCGRSLWLGEPMAIPLHRLQNGALLLFAFFMISDPRTTPDSRLGRIVFAALVALGGGYVQFKLFRTNGLLYALAAAAPLVPLIDRLFPGARHEWTAAPSRRDG